MRALLKFLVRRPETTAQKLLLAGIALSVVGGLVLAALTASEWVHLRRWVGARLVGAEVEVVAQEVASFFRPLARSLEAIDRWGRSAEADPLDTSSLSSFALPLVDPLEEVMALEVINPQGQRSRLDRGEEGWLASSSVAGEEQESVPAWLETATQRAAPGKIYWISGGSGEGAGDGDLTAALRSEGGDRVYALHISMDAVEAFIDGVVLPEAEVMVVRSDGTVIRYSRADDTPFVLVDVVRPDDDLGSSVSAVVPAYLEWRVTGLGDDPFLLRHDGEAWWAVFKAVGDEGGGGATVLGVTVQEAQIVSGIERTRSTLFYLLLVAVGTGIALLVALGLVNTRRLADDQAPRPPTASEVEDLIRSGESERLELKSTLRWNLNKDKPGKEVEMSAMKTVAAFLNSGGGTLLVGVADDGQVVGTGNDRFPNEDRFLLHFNNLVKEHLGLAQGGSLTFGFRDAQGKRVFFVSCGRAREPVFLKAGSSEKFYVRLGPGSRELKPSQVLEYVKSQ